MTRHQRWLAHAASRSIGWTIFFALLTSPLGGYLYLGRLRRMAAFLLLFALGMGLVGWLVDTCALPMGVADGFVAVGFVGSLIDQAWVIRDARRRLQADGWPVPPFRS